MNAFLLETEKLKTALEEDQNRLTIVNDDIDESKQAYEQTKEEYDQIETAIEQLNSIIESSKTRFMRTGLQKSVLKVR